MILKMIVPYWWPLMLLEWDSTCKFNVLTFGCDLQEPCHLATATAVRNCKKAIGLIDNTTTLYVHQPLLYVSLPSLCDYVVIGQASRATFCLGICLISRYMEDVNKRPRNFLSISEPGHGSQDFNTTRVRIHLTK